MKLLPFREIIRNTGSISEEQVFLAFTQGHRNEAVQGNECGIIISPDLVPRLVSDKQFEVIKLRRRVQMFIEEQRLAKGTRADGLREGRFKHIQKHFIAKARRRDAQGTFMPGGTKHTLSISN